LEAKPRELSTLVVNDKGIIVYGSSGGSRRYGDRLPARAEDLIVKLVSAAKGRRLQPVNGSHNQGKAVVQHWSRPNG
jgi:hypothetical protein